ncbi:AraC family transcriptional regulator [Cohnella sp. GCM10020058]|uniref:AraC family transcriptional regulator n=1 Tax=Cohnella sp. GCM10020058 TaxID=3317330 RepID=UPI0036265D16
MKFLKLNISRPLSFVSAGNFVADEPWIHTKRTITSFELIIVVRDTVYLELGHEPYALQPKETLLILPNQPHCGYDWSNKNCSFHWFHFQCESDYELIDEKELYADLIMLDNNPYLHRLADYVYIPVFSCPPEIERVNILFHQLLHTMESGYYTGHSLNYLVTLLLIELSEQTLSQLKSQSRTDEAADPAEKKLMKMLEWIRIHSAENISVQDVAMHFTYNKDYLIRFFKKHMGMSMQEYIHSLKIAKAKNMLYQSSASIKEIAFALGFQDEKYFMKLFKRLQGLTPTEFRRAYYRTHLNNK